MNENKHIVEKFQDLWIRSLKLKLIANFLNVDIGTIQLINDTKNYVIECITPTNKEKIKDIFNEIKTLEIDKWQLSIIWNILKIDYETWEFISDEVIKQYLSPFTPEEEIFFSEIREGIAEKDLALIQKQI